MRKTTGLFFIYALLIACNTDTSRQTTHQEGEQFKSELKQGKWTTDICTSQELMGMHITIENFTLLSKKKKLENIQAYQEFADLISLQISRVLENSKLDTEAKKMLVEELNKMKNELATLQGTNMDASKKSLSAVNNYMTEIDSTFNYLNQ